VSVRDVVAVLQAAEMVVRISEEVDEYLVELGTDGRLIALQLEEIGTGVDENLRLVVRDYALAPGVTPKTSDSPDGAAGGPVVQRALDALHALSAEELLEPGNVAAATWGLGSDPRALDAAVEAQGFRLLRRLPRVSEAIIERIVARFVTLPRIMQASLGDLETVDGVGESKARSVKDGLAHMVEASILERYQ